MNSDKNMFLSYVSPTANGKDFEESVKDTQTQGGGKTLILNCENSMFK